MVKIAIVEDEREVQDKMCNYVSQFFDNAGVECHLTCFSDGNKFLLHFDNEYDLVLMDIQLNESNGFETAQKLRKINNDVIIIFVTNLSQFAVKGYEVEALAYVVKPVTYSMLSLVLDRALTRIRNKADKYLILKKEGETLRLPVSQIKYIEVVDHELIYHTVEKDFALRGSLNNVEKEFLKFGFFRCNRYAIVNLKHVTSVKEYEIKIGNNERVAVSHSRRQALLKTLAEYYTQGGTI